MLLFRAPRSSLTYLMVNCSVSLKVGAIDIPRYLKTFLR